MIKSIKKHYKKILSFGLLGVILSIAFWRYPYQSEPIKYFSIFDLMEQISSEKSSLAKQNELANYNGVAIKDDGFIVDVASDYKNNLVAEIVKNLDVDGFGRYTSSTINCQFSQEWSNKLLSIDFPDEIKFTGTIPTAHYSNPNPFKIINKNGPQIVLYDCAIES